MGCTVRIRARGTVFQATATSALGLAPLSLLDQFGQFASAWIHRVLHLFLQPFPGDLAVLLEIPRVLALYADS